MNISLLLITKNEQSNLTKYWKWLSKLKQVNELIVVDDRSTDETLQILKKITPASLTLKTYTRDLSGNFSTQRQHGVSKCLNDWILYLDADEQPSKELISWLNNIDLNQYSTNTCFSFRRQDTSFGHTFRYTEAGNSKHIRLFHKDSGQFIGSVHEVWNCQNITDTNLTISHHPHPTLESFWKAINFYSTLRATELHKQHISVSSFDFFIYPSAKFFQNYFLRFGFLDGIPGIILSLGMSFHSFLVRSKLWHLYQSSK